MKRQNQNRTHESRRRQTTPNVKHHIPHDIKISSICKTYNKNLSKIWKYTFPMLLDIKQPIWFNNHTRRGHLKSPPTSHVSGNTPGITEVPRNLETPKSGNMTNSGEISLNVRTEAKSQSGTGQGVRRRKRPLLACRTRCNCSMETFKLTPYSTHSNRITCAIGRT